MLQAAGITAEYNPLHNGHVYHMHMARERSGCDAVVVAMSGDYVQRGEPAALDKWTRTKHALSSGADLVIEIPVLYCLADAGRYAGASVRLLESLGCVSHIAFGSESGNTEAVTLTAEFLSANEGELREEIRRLARSGMSYPAARAAACERLGGSKEMIAILRQPNDILAVEYTRAMKSSLPVAIRRAGAGYDDGIQDCEEYQSASGIRDALRRGCDVSGYVPECVSRDLVLTHSYIYEESRRKLFDMIRYRLMSSAAAEIDDCPSGGEGLGNSLKNAARSAQSLDELILAAKSRRYTYTRISRLLMQVLVGIHRSEHYPVDEEGSYTADEPAYIRILGFNEAGRSLLSQIRREHSASLPIITNINKERCLLDERAGRMLELDIHAADVYNLIRGMDIYRYSDYRRSPVIL